MAHIAPTRPVLDRPNGATRQPRQTAAPTKQRLATQPGPADRANAAGQNHLRWTVEDCGQLVGSYHTAQDARDARDAHLAQYWDWDADHADIAVDAVTVQREADPNL